MVMVENLMIWDPSYLYYDENKKMRNSQSLQQCHIQLRTKAGQRPIGLGTWALW